MMKRVGAGAGCSIGIVMSQAWKLEPEWVWKVQDGFVVIEHSAHPCAVRLDNTEPNRAVLHAATAYLSLVGQHQSELASIADQLRADLAGSDGAAWRWAHVNQSDPWSSYIVMRTTNANAPGGGRSVNQTAVLIARPAGEHASGIGLLVCGSIVSRAGQQYLEVLGTNVSVVPSDFRNVLDAVEGPLTSEQTCSLPSDERTKWPEEWQQQRERKPLAMKLDPVSKFGVLFEELDEGKDLTGLNLALVSDNLGFDEPSDPCHLVELSNQWFTVHEPGEPGDSPPAASIPFDMSALNSGSDKVWAASAYLHMGTWFARLKDDGHDVGKLLQFLKFPLSIYISGRVNGGIGNAQVSWVNHLGIQSPNGSARMPLHVIFSEERTRRVSICCDPRWCLHELGHVMLAGTTGSLELPFCHSVGDALAAISQDPQSVLQDAFQRGRTFPWIGLAAATSDIRRHDRSPGGDCMWRDDDDGTTNPPPGDLRGYKAEQILSSALFDAYKRLGGNSKAADGSPDRRKRQAAADHTLALVTQALALLGPATTTPARVPKVFAAALLRADETLGPYHCRSTGEVRSAGSARQALLDALMRFGLKLPITSAAASP
jgi:hypothetical protein